jgi:predicted MFS family arabinose efflux permease
MAANGIIIAIIEMVMIYKLEGRRNILIYITTGTLLVAASFLLLTIPGPAAFIAIAMIITVTFGEIFSMPFMNTYWIKRTQPANRGQYAALYTMAWSAAQTLGPVFGARLADKAGFNILWWCVGALLIFTAIGFRLLKK